MDPDEKFVETFQQILFAQFRGLGDPLLVLEKLDEDEARAVERGRAVGQESLAQGGFSAQQQGEENVGVNDDTGRVHSAPSGVTRRSFACHQSDLMSSDNFQAASGVRRLRRTTLSTRSQETKSLTSSGVMPSVGMVTCRRPFSALTAIMVEIYNAKAELSKHGLPACHKKRGRRDPATHSRRADLLTFLEPRCDVGLEGGRLELEIATGGRRLTLRDAFPRKRIPPLDGP